VSTRRRDVIVVGAGHNGLVAACYLAKAGLDVEVVERDTVVGGAVSTVQRWPGVRVDRGSTTHLMIRHTGIVEELELGTCGLAYIATDPWAVSLHDDAVIEFHVDVAATCASIAATCGDRDAEAYQRFARRWLPRVRALLRALDQPPTPLGIARSFWPLGRLARSSGGELAREFLAPADHLLDTTFDAERLKTALSWWAAQAGAAPHEVGTAPMLATALLMHLRPPGRPRGGSGMLSEALSRRLQALGGTVRLGDAAAQITRRHDGCAVRTTTGEVIEARVVVAACHVATTIDLLEPAADLDAARSRLRIGTGMGVALRLLTSELPAYSARAAAMHDGMQLAVKSRDQLRAAYADFLRGEVPTDPPLLVMTPTATDPTLAPAGSHVVTVWSQWYPRHPRHESWADIRSRETDRLVYAMDRVAPGFSSSVRESFLQTPEDLETELGLRGGNVMHLEMSLDAIFALRPLPEWSRYRGPRPGLYLCGASTHPGGGVSGVSGRNAAAAVLRDLGRRSLRSRIGYRR
jgi:phytoene dehydrogenase-like protein